jgi:acetyl esterase/lipase
MRKLVTVAAVLMGLCGLAGAQAKDPCTAAGEDNAWLGLETIRLWQGDAPQARGSGCEDVPTLTIVRPQPGHGTGSAVVVLPGGGYAHLSGILEGRQVADWFTSRGFTAFILQYRLSSHGYLLPVPLLDARRAVQTVRSRAAEYKIEPNRIAIIGFSAGGHLAALASVQPLTGDPAAADPMDRVSSRPDYLILGYPWIGAISSDTSHLSYCKEFHVMDRCEALRMAYSPELFVDRNTPPTFWYHTADDGLVPVDQGLRFYEALLKAGVPAEGHIFTHGQHGTGMGMGDPALDQWPALLETWLRKQGLIPAVMK